MKLVLLPCLAAFVLGQGINHVDTNVTLDLNNRISAKPGCLYCGGKGVLLRNHLDGYQNDWSKKVLPATFWVNDIVVPSQIYPDMDITEKQDEACWRASVAVVVGNNLHCFFPHFASIQSDDWGYGVFYATDSNAVDGRCRNLAGFGGYDCPGGWLTNMGDFQSTSDKTGAGGSDFGNPFAGLGGGGAGCHFEARLSEP